MSGPKPQWATDPLNAANVRRNRIEAGLTLAHSQESVLRGRLADARLKAIALRDGLNAVKTTATAGSLSTPTAGDTMITAITTLVTDLDTALLALRGVSSLTYASYAEEA